jgi:hypothetical protein
VKVQVINLEPEDDHISAREKLRWTKAPRAVFVWPGRGRVLTRLLDLKLLQRQAERQGTQIGLVTLDPDTIYNAHELGIPVFETLGEIETGHWHVRPRAPSEPHANRNPESREELLRNPPARALSRPTQPSRTRYALFALGFTLPLMMLLSLLPAAHLVVAPEAQQLDENAVFQLTSDDSEDPESHLLPIQTFTIRVSGSMRTPTSGRSSQPSIQAKGEIQITNISASTVILAQGTRVLPVDAPGPTFQTDAGAVIPPGDTKSIGVTAVQPGPDGNLPGGTIWAIEGPAGLSIEAVSPSPTSGGALSTRSAVSSADRLALTRQLQAQLLEQARSQMEDRLSIHELLIPESVKPERVLEADFDHESGDAADSVALTTTIDVTGIAYDRELLLVQLSRVVSASLPQGWHLIPGSVEIQMHQFAPRLAGTNAELRVDYQASIYAEPDRDSLIATLRLKPVDQLERAFSASKIEAELVSSNITPAWLPFFPAFNFQYDINLPWEQIR